MCDEEPPAQMTFSYKCQIHYDSNFYIGQVIDIASPFSAVIEFLAPRTEMIISNGFCQMILYKWNQSLSSYETLM